MDKLTDWKAHPVIVALASGAAVIGFMIQFIVPIFVKERDVEIADLKKQIVSLPGAIENASKLERENKELKLKIRELSTDNIFSTDDVFPKGYRTVRIGDPLAKAREVYAGKEVAAEEDSYVAFKTGDTLFRQAAFYFDKSDKKRIIKHVLFITDFSDETTELLRRQLAEKFGSANMKEDRKHGQWELTVLGFDLQLTKNLYSIELHAR